MVCPGAAALVVVDLEQQTSPRPRERAVWELSDEHGLALWALHIRTTGEAKRVREGGAHWSDAGLHRTFGRRKLHAKPVEEQVIYLKE